MTGEQVMNAIDARIEQAITNGEFISIEEMALIGIFKALEDINQHGLRTYEQNTIPINVDGSYTTPIHVLIDNTGDFIQ